jgi:uncharacterized protein YndB with AHSA1/START domain
MEKHTFKITIDAPRERVWEILWGENTYPAWTSVFSEGSRVETDWEVGSKVLFLGGDDGGLVSRIADKKPNEFMSFRHEGMMQNGVEVYDDPKMKEWSGAMENYTLKAVDGKTELTINIDLTDEYKEYFEKAWPQALEKLKDMAEKREVMSH